MVSWPIKELFKLVTTPKLDHLHVPGGRKSIITKELKLATNWTSDSSRLGLELSIKPLTTEVTNQPSVTRAGPIGRLDSTF